MTCCECRTLEDVTGEVGPVFPLGVHFTRVVCGFLGVWTVLESSPAVSERCSAALDLLRARAEIVAGILVKVSAETTNLLHPLGLQLDVYSHALVPVDADTCKEKRNHKVNTLNSLRYKF